MPPLPVSVLDVVVDKAEVVPEFYRRRARKGVVVVARYRCEGEQPEQRADALAGCPTSVQTHVVPAHLVEATGARVLVGDEAEYLLLGGSHQFG